MNDGGLVGNERPPAAELFRNIVHNTDRIPPAEPRRRRPLERLVMNSVL